MNESRVLSRSVNEAKKNTMSLDSGKMNDLCFFPVITSDDNWHHAMGEESRNHSANMEFLPN